jgi:TonB family protein
MFGQNSADSIRSKSAQVVLDTTYFDKDWKKSDSKSADYYRVRQQVESGFTIDYYSKNGTPVENGHYASLVPEIRQGHFVTYFENGIKSSEYNCINDTVQGEALDYYPSGKIMMKMNYLNNLKDGNNFEYFEDGSLKFIRKYKNGELIEVSMDPTNPKPIFTVVEDSPEFPGGDEARMNYLAHSLKYPQEARENNIQGTVYVEFVVEIDGSLTRIKVLRGIGSGCDEECVRVVKLMPKWNPGKQRGNPVRSQFVLPVQFILN